MAQDFPAKERDSEIKLLGADSPNTTENKLFMRQTGLDYFGARYYSSGLSVWLSVDALGGKYPALSPYMYTAGNPVNMIDPDGRHFKDPNDEIRAYRSMDKASEKIFEYKHRVTELLKNRKNWNKHDKIEYREKKRMIKILEKHKKGLYEMINIGKIEYMYQEIDLEEATISGIETYVRNGKVIMQFVNGMPDKQAHEETHGHQYLTGELKIKNNGDNKRAADLTDEAKAYQVEYSYRDDRGRAYFRKKFNVGQNNQPLKLVNSVRDIGPNNMVKSKVIIENYPNLVQKYYSH